MVSGNFAKTYTDVLALQKSNVRSKVRHIALDILAAKDTLLNGNAELDKPRVQFLYLHHIFTDEVVKFDQLLNRLSKQHTFISHTEAVNKLLSGTVDRPYISFSMDDGMKNNMIAAEILDKYGAKGCFFINPGTIGETNYETIKKHCIQTLDFPVVDFMDWKDVEQLQARGHEIGAHTMYHMNMAKATRQQLYDDLGQTMDVIKTKCGITPHFAFPYGTFTHFNRQALNAVFDTGYLSCISAERGCNINPATKMDAKDLCLRRDQIICYWPIPHQMYFVIRSARNASEANNHYPANWQ